MQTTKQTRQGRRTQKQANPPLKLNYYFAFVSNLRAEVTHKTEVKRDKVGSFSKNFNVYKKKQKERTTNQKLLSTIKRGTTR